MQYHTPHSRNIGLAFTILQVEWIGIRNSQSSELPGRLDVELLHEEVDEGQRDDDGDEDRAGVGDGDDCTPDLKKTNSS